MQKVFVKDDGRFRELAEAVIAEKGPRYADVNEIIFATVDGDPQDYLAKAIKIPGQYRPFLDAKFMILFNVMQISSQGAQKNLDLIMYHELLHTNCEMDKLTEHDVEDFSAMIKEYGLAWSASDGRNIVDEEFTSKFSTWMSASAVELDDNGDTGEDDAKPELQEAALPVKPKKVKPVLAAAPALIESTKPDIQARIAKAFGKKVAE